MNLSPLPYPGGEGGAPQAGAGRRKVTAKALKRALKKAGLRTSGKKAALTRRAKKAHLKIGGAGEPGAEAAPVIPPTPPAGRRRSQKNGLVRGTLRSVGRLGRSVFGRGGVDEQEL